MNWGCYSIISELSSTKHCPLDTIRIIHYLSLFPVIDFCMIQFLATQGLSEIDHQKSIILSLLQDWTFLAWHSISLFRDIYYRSTSLLIRLDPTNSICRLIVVWHIAGSKFSKLLSSINFSILFAPSTWFDFFQYWFFTLYSLEAIPSIYPNYNVSDSSLQTRQLFYNTKHRHWSYHYRMSFQSPEH